MKKAVVIGSGFAGIASAASLARKGFEVLVLEKNLQPGGRAGVWKQDGFTFDMGPSFYWMPEVFERFFGMFGEKVEDHYELVRLDPSYKVIFNKTDHWSLPADPIELRAFFDRVEPGAGAKLDQFLAQARVKYDLGMGKLVYRPSLSWLEYARPEVLSGLLRTSVFTSLRQHVRDHFKDERLRTLMEFPVLFLGASPQNTPALYSLMNHADMTLGTWYPIGGMGKVVEAMVRLAEDHGVHFKYGSPVVRVNSERGKVKSVSTAHAEYVADVVVAAADYNHVEQELLQPAERAYDEDYWDTRVMAPSGLLFYLGFNKKFQALEHHTLFFDESLDDHTAEIYSDPAWPQKPLFYVSCASRTDVHVAPPGHENMVVLIPIAPGLPDTPELREHYFQLIMDRLKFHLDEDLRSALVLKRSYCINDLKNDHNAFRGNAYGLANTLRQTGPWRPSMKSRKVKGLYYAGQLTVPGPGVPPAIISGQVVADLIEKEFIQRPQHA
jgi:phytoene desaturase